MSKRIFLAAFVVFGWVFLSIACGSTAPTEAPAAAVVDRYPNGVVMELPEQESGARLQSKEVVLASPLPTEVAGEYEFINPIIYLDVYDEQEKPVNSFIPPIVFYADIPEDLKPVAEAQDLVILLYDTEVKRWIPCDGIQETKTPTTQCSATTISEDLEQAWVMISSWTSGTGWGK